MESFDFLFASEYPEIEFADISAHDILRKSFWDVWSGLLLPDYFIGPLDIWPHSLEECELCNLWEFLVGDILTSSLIYFRKRCPCPKFNLSELIRNSDLKGDYSDYSRNMKQKVPPIIKRIFGIVQKEQNGPYEIRTPYPNLVAALIAGAGKSPLSPQQNTRNSLMQNLEFSKLCLSCITSAQNKPSHPAEESYIFERLFSIQAKIGLFHLQSESGEYPQSQLNLIRYMPNITSRLGFAQALFPFPEPEHSSEEECCATGWLKVIGGYIFPAWQSLFCSRMLLRYQYQEEVIIDKIADLMLRVPNRTELAPLQTFSAQKTIYTRAEKESYAAFVKPWDFDWWTLAEGLSDGSEDVNSLLLQNNPLADYEFLSACLA